MEGKLEKAALGSKALRVAMALVLLLGLIPSQLLGAGKAYADTSGYLSVGGEIWYGGWNTNWFDVDGNVAYCGNPSAATPGGGWYGMDAIGDAAVAAGLWYGYGGPGFDESMWPSTWYDGSGMDAEKYAALTHIVLADLWSGDGWYSYGQCSWDFIDWCQWNVVGYSIDDGSLLNEDAIRVRLGWYGFAAGSTGSWPSSFEAYYMGTGGWTQSILTFRYSPTGKLDIVKTSANTVLSDGNRCMSLKGAEYGVYADSGCKQLVCTMVTDSNGYAASADLAPGSYWVKEAKASLGYALDRTVYPVTVSSGQTTRVNGGTVSEMPKSDPVSMVVAKADSDLGAAPQGAATLEGAEFTVSFYKGDYASSYAAEESGAAVRTWVLSTDEDGFCYLSDEYKVSGDDFYYQSDGVTPTLPLGTVVIQETKAPKGYVLDDGNGGEPRKFCVRITDDGAVGESVYTYNKPEASDSVIRGGVEVRKVDSDLGDEPQGDATLGGAAISIKSLNEQAVVVEGSSYGYGDTVKQIVTKWDEESGSYVASTRSDCLPYGRYVAVEGCAPDGYDTNVEWSQEFVITYDGQMVEITTDEDALPEEVYRGGVAINKTDEETGVTFQGDATFAGAEFDIVNESKGDVVVDGTVYAPGDVVKTVTTKLDAETGLAVAGTSDDCLPYGTYRIVEVKAPDGYLNKGRVSQRFQVREPNVVVDLTATPISNDVVRGGVAINKADAQTGTDAQGDATFEGAEFSITNLSEGPVLVDGTLYAPGEVCKVIHTELDEDGLAVARTASDCLPYGTYSIEETSAPEGYLNTGSLYRTFQIRNDGVTVDLTSKPISNDVARGGVAINKADSETGTDPQGDATFEKAAFDIVNMSEAAVTVEGKSYAPGEVVKTIAVELDEATGLYTARTSADCLPYGTYKVVESSVPMGYTADGTTERAFQIRENGVMVDLTSTPIMNDVVRGGVQINKSDVQTGTDAQGDATFEGAEFSITNESEHAVLVDGVLYEPGEVCKVITTVLDQDTGLAVASTASDCLPYGTYSLDETKAPEGYLGTGDTHRDFQIRKDGATVDLTSEPVANDVIRGGVRVEKDDLELGKSEAVGGKEHSSDEGACLSGIGFTITSMSPQAVVVQGETYEPGDEIETVYTHWSDELQAYVAETPADELPYGTYSIQETSTNSSYLLTDGEARTFQIREDGAIVAAAADGVDLTFDDQVVRNDIELSKMAEDTNEAIQAAFKVTNVETGEAHVLVCDRNGDASTAASWNRHTANTNGNDWALGADAVNVADLDPEAGIWFGLGEDGSWAEPDDSLAAMPYGRYTLEELRSDSNEGYDMVTRDVWVSRDSTVARAVWMSLDDRPSETIRTQAADADDGNGYADADEQVTVVDTVYYENLKTDGREYTVEGTLMVKSTNSPLLDAEGNPVTASRTFTPMLSAGTVELEFTFDGSLLAGETVVVFEDLVQDGKVVATHSAIDDEGQSVSLVRIGTTASDASDGDKHVTGATATIEDEVAYEGLVPGRAYTLRASLMDAETGKPVVRDSSLIFSENVIAEASFTAEDVCGTAAVKIECGISELGGHRLVVFEDLYDADGELVATHADLSDEGQSVRVSEIGTTLTDASDGDHVVTAGKVTLTDTVEYKGLIPGETYAVKGTLMSKTTGSTFVSGGKAVVATAAFQAESSEGAVEVEFTFDTGDLEEGEMLVAFEQLLSAEGSLVASHEDIDDEAQTVVVDNPDTPEVPDTPSSSLPKTGDNAAPAAAATVLAALAAVSVVVMLASRRSRRRKEGENQREQE